MGQTKDATLLSNAGWPPWVFMQTGQSRKWNDMYTFSLYIHLLAVEEEMAVTQKGFWLHRGERGLVFPGRMLEVVLVTVQCFVGWYIYNVQKKTDGSWIDPFTDATMLLQVSIFIVCISGISRFISISSSEFSYLCRIQLFNTFCSKWIRRNRNDLIRKVNSTAERS